MELMLAVWKPSVKRVNEEVADMQALANKEGAKIKSSPGIIATTWKKFGRTNTISIRIK